MWMEYEYDQTVGKETFFFLFPLTVARRTVISRRLRGGIFDRENHTVSHFFATLDKHVRARSKELRTHIPLCTSCNRL